MSFRHPSHTELETWLNGDDGPQPRRYDAEAVDRHLRTCERCAATIERLASADTEEDEEVGSQLSLLLAPPPDLNDRLERRVADALNSRQVFGVVADLFGAGLETSRMLFIDEGADQADTLGTPLEPEDDA
ncbi:MAG: anti-sigma factor family protein [Acidimicrobiales bacterium]